MPLLEFPATLRSLKDVTGTVISVLADTSRVFQSAKFIGDPRGPDRIGSGVLKTLSAAQKVRGK